MNYLKKYPVGTIIEGQIVSKNEYSLFVKIQDLDADVYRTNVFKNGEDELAKYKKGDKIKVKVLEIKVSEQVRVGYRQTQKILLIGLKTRKLVKQLQLKLYIQIIRG